MGIDKDGDIKGVAAGGEAERAIFPLPTLKLIPIFGAVRLLVAGLEDIEDCGEGEAARLRVVDGGDFISEPFPLVAMARNSVDRKVAMGKANYTSILDLKKLVAGQYQNRRRRYYEIEPLFCAKEQRCLGRSVSRRSPVRSCHRSGRS